MAEPGTRPLVTFYVAAYNQARFIREAVGAALAQTYSPMQIILSDDGSADGTFEIMQDAVKGYQGPHTLILNRNPRNLGLSEHLNWIMERAAGELVVAADGDDVSSPHRTERCVRTWLTSGKPAALVSSVSCIDADGSPSRLKDGPLWFAQFLPAARESRTACLRRFCRVGSPRLISCSAAWTKEMFDAFGPLPSRVWFEDDVMTLRAWLFDRIVFIPETLVSYREHTSNMFNRVGAPLSSMYARDHAEEATRIEAQRRRESLLAYLPDLELALRRQWIAPPLYQQLRPQVDIRIAFYKVVAEWWTVAWVMRLPSLLFLLRAGRLRGGRWGVARLLPFDLFLALGAIWSRRRG